MTSEDRAALVRMHVSSAIEAGANLTYSRLDALHKQDIHDDDVIKALQDLGETQLLEDYAEWGQLILPDAIDPEETTDDVVPDPGDSPSYDSMPSGVAK